MPEAGSPLDFLITGCIACIVGSGFIYSAWRGANEEDESETAEIVREETNPIAMFLTGIFVVIVGIVLIVSSQVG